MCANRLASRRSWAAALVAAFTAFGVFAIQAEAKDPSAKAQPAVPAKAEARVDGHELFTREWLPNDARAHGGDGLGPVFNDSSCVACHNQGGAGGAGPSSKNVDIITAFTIPTAQFAQQESLPQGLFNLAFGALAPPVPVQPVLKGKPVAAHVPTAKERKLAKEQERQQLIKLHPGFASARSVVLHHFGIDPNYQSWRSGVFNGQGMFANQPMSLSVTNVDTVATVTESGAVIPQAIPDQSTTPQQVAPPQVAPPQVAPPQVAPPQVAVPSPPAPILAPVPPTPPAQVADGADGSQVSAAEIVSNDIVFSSQLGSLEAIPEVQQLQNDVRTNHSQILNSTTQSGNIQISRSQRNPTALFGIGLIDAIPEKAIVDLAKLEHEKYSDVAGRPSKQKDGKIGRFGWKAQKPSLEDFALTACAVELGLNVPGHEQAGVPLKPNYKAPGLDMNKAECDALVGYLRNLPAPTARKPANTQEAGVVAAGHKLFASTGCAACHVEKVASANGIYSDLLLHDMGPELGDSGNYGVFTPDAPEEEQDDLAQPVANFNNPFSPQGQLKMTPAQLAKVVGALRQEWRTPPLWGVRDSGPYLHDGRADTLEQAVAFHGGQGAPSAIKFFKLKPEERQQVIAFLKSLTAPEPTAAAAKLAVQ